mmetsp:Transcript_101559/g.287771  ORF Transcript_101559/g.287771 Transcript_101559/m.287771 type:complete len:299 (+) Transcript_101559:149-1045(+)
MVIIMERLLEHPTVRPFLLQFNEKEWADVIQCAAVLGIQALQGRYGPSARLADVPCLRSLIRWRERQGDWPTSLLELPGVATAKGGPLGGGHRTTRAKSPPDPYDAGGGGCRCAPVPRGGGRSLSSGRPFRRPGSAAAPGGAAERPRRRRSAPPRLAPPRAVAPREEPHAKPSPQPLHVHVPMAAPGSTASSARAAGGVRGDSAPTDEWYATLMSRLQRLSNKHSDKQCPAPSHGVATAPSTAAWEPTPQPHPAVSPQRCLGRHRRRSKSARRGLAGGAGLAAEHVQYSPGGSGSFYF